jgi:urea carboxylase system permease
LDDNAVATTPLPDADADLERLGYRAELRRAVGSFITFAASFALISIVVGFLTAYGLTYAFAGPPVVWTIPIVFVGQLFVALVFAELASHYPLAGSIYQWSTRLGGRAWGWQASWLYIGAWFIVLPSVGIGLQIVLTAISPRFQFIGNGVPGIFDPAFAENAIILALIMFAISTVVNLLGIRALAWASTLGLAAEFAGIAMLIVVLGSHVTRGPSVLWQTDDLGQGYAWGYFGVFIIGAFLPMYQLFGFDQATTLAEETKEPRRQGPQSLLRSLVAAGALGFVIAFLAPLAAPKVTDPNIGAEGLPYLMSQLGGSGVGKAFLWVGVICLVMAGVQAHALIARMTFAMARDNSVIGSRMLSHVSPRTQIPPFAVLAPTVVWVALLLINLGNPRIFEAMLGAGTVLVYLAYLGVTIPMLRARLNKSWVPRSGLFQLPRRAGLVVAVLAVVWGVLGAVNLIWPRPEFYGTLWYQRYSAFIFPAVVLGIGLVQYWLVRHRPQPGVTLEEHRSASAAIPQHQAPGDPPVDASPI